jgi:hypothetical protein
MSLAEARYCALGVRCKLYDPELGKAQKLGRYHKSTICDRCRTAAYTPEDVPNAASSATPNNEKSFVETGGDIEHDADEHSFWKRLHEVGLIADSMPTDEPFRPPEEEFGEVFRAARKLFDENVNEEDLIIPTLVFANQASAISELGDIRERFANFSADGGQREQFVNDFEQRFRGLEPASLSDDVLILRSIRLSPSTGALGCTAREVMR